MALSHHTCCRVGHITADRTANTRTHTLLASITSPRSGFHPPVVVVGCVLSTYLGHSDSVMVPVPLNCAWVHVSKRRVCIQCASV